MALFKQAGGAIAGMAAIALPFLHSRFWRDRSGSVAVLTALTAVALMGFAGLAVDVSSWENGQMRVQSVADTAALAAGRAAVSGQTASTDAFAVAAANGFTHGTGGATVTVNQPPQSGNYTTDANAIEVIVTQTQQGTFSRLFLQTAPTVIGRAVVNADAGACVIILGASNSAWTSSGGTNFNTPNCDFYNNGGSSLSGNSAITAHSIYFAEPPTANRNFTHTTPYVTNATPVADPYRSRTVPSYSCASSGSLIVTSSRTFSGGGTFCGGITASSSGTLNFNDGIYIFNKSLTLSSSYTINTSNATLIFVNGAGITTSGATSFNLVAPTSGSTAGMAIWVSGNTGITISGASSLNLTGAIYIPNGSLTTSGATGATCGQLVVGSLTTSGNFGLQHNCSGTGISDVGGLALME